MHYDNNLGFWGSAGVASYCFWGLTGLGAAASVLFAIEFVNLLRRL